MANRNDILMLGQIRNDPTYNMDIINSKPDWKLAFELSEVDNDNAPIGWFSYIHLASHLNRKYEIKTKEPHSQKP